MRLDRSALMSNPTLVLLIGMVTACAVLLAQWWLVTARPEQFRTERLRGAVALSVLFFGFAALHWYVAEAERPDEPCCLMLLGEEEPPSGGGPQMKPPPAPPRPPS